WRKCLKGPATNKQLGRSLFKPCVPAPASLTPMMVLPVRVEHALGSAAAALELRDSAHENVAERFAECRVGISGHVNRAGPWPDAVPLHMYPDPGAAFLNAAVA